MGGSLDRALARYREEEQADLLATLEALADTRVAGAETSLPAGALAAELAAFLPDSRWETVRRELEAESLAREAAGAIALAAGARPRVLEALDAHRRARTLHWATRTVTQGEILDAFAAYCSDELDDVELLEEQPARLALGWRRERSAVELRAGFLFCDRLVHEGPTLLLGELRPALVERLLDDAGLRVRLAVYDLVRLEKVNAVRSSVFVHFEWFLRDRFGVKVLPASAFTQGLVDRGIISLGMG